MLTTGFRQMVGAAVCVVSMACAYRPGDDRGMGGQIAMWERMDSPDGLSYAELESLMGPPLCVVRVERPHTPEWKPTRVRELIDSCGRSAIRPRPVPPGLVTADVLVLSYSEPRTSIWRPEYLFIVQGGRVVSDVFVDAQANTRIKRALERIGAWMR